MSRVFAPRSAPDITRPQLPRIQLRAYWDIYSGLYVSLHGPDVSTALDDFYRPAPEVLKDDLIWKAFMPVVIRNHGPLFGRLNVSDIELSQHIVLSNGTYHLSMKLADSWYRLEHALLDIISFLHPRHPHVADIPLAFPQFPHQLGYRDLHRSPRSALLAAKASKDAFTPLSALVTFFLSIFLNTDAQTPFDNVFYDLSHKKNPITVPFLMNLESSYVCDLSLSMRRGCFLDAYRTKWSGFFDKFVSARVGIWLLWGDASNAVPADPTIFRYFPPEDLIALAKERYAVVAEMREEKLRLLVEATNHVNTAVEGRLELGGGFHHHRMEHTEVGMAEENPVVDTALEDVSRLFQAAGRQELEFVKEQAEILERILEPGTPEPGSRQRFREGWREFFDRMELERKEYIRNERPRQRVDRLNHEVVYQRTKTYTNQSRVYLWRERSGFWIRTQLGKEDKDEIPVEWDDSTEHQRLFFSHVNEWDICPQMDAYPPGTARPPFGGSEDLSNEAHSFLFSEPSTQKSIPVPPPPKAFSLLESAQRLLDSITSFSNPPSTSLFDKARCRYGFLVELFSSFSPTAPIKFQASSYEDVEKNLSWGGGEDVVRSNGSKYVGLFNVFSQEIWAVGNLPNFIDMSPRCPRRLELNQKLFFLRRYQLQGKDFYLITPPTSTFDSRSWVIATPDASTVLHVYRSGWTNMSEVASGLLAVCARFHTALEVRDHIPLGVSSRHSSDAVGLGYRPDSYEPTPEDLEVYLLKLKATLRSPAGRALRMRGGIVGRLARDLVDEDDVLLGPVSHTTLITLPGTNVSYVDDSPSTNDLLVVCGVFMMYSKTGVQQLSWWPQEIAWAESSMAASIWTPAVEKWYRDRWQDIKSGKAKLYSATAWKRQIRYFARVSQPVRRRVEEISKQFIAQAF